MHCLPCTQCFCQNFHLWTYRMPYALSWYSTQYCSDQGTHFKVKHEELHKKRSTAMSPWSCNSLLLPCCHHPKASGSKEQWNGLLKIQLQWCNTLQSQGNVLQKAVYALTQHPTYGYISPRDRIHGSRNWAVEMWVAPLTISLNHPLATFLLLIPMTSHPQQTSALFV